MRLYARQAGAQKVPVDNLQAAIGGDRIFYVPVARGVQLFTGTLPTLPRDAIPAENLKGGKPATVNLTVKGKKYIAVVQPLKIINQLFGAMVVAKPVSQLRSRWVTLAERLALAFGGGVIIAGLLGVYLTRRMTDPLMQLSSAADEVAAGNYDVELPEPRGHDEIAQLTGSFGAMTSKLAESEQLSRNFLMSVSHELRTPLTAIRGHVAALSEGVFEDPAARDASLDVIAEEALRLERLVGDVLDLAKLDAHRFTVLQEEVDMEQLCERAFTAFGEEARRRSIDYRSDFRASPVIMTDGDRVLQIISNLLSNAFRWTPEGGRVELELSAANGSVSGRRRRHGAGDSRRRAGPDLPAVLVARRRRDRARARDRERARAGARREARRAERPGSRQPVRARLAWSRLARLRVGGAALLHAVHDRAGLVAELVLDPRQALVDARQPARDELDEECKIVDACVPLGEEVALDPLEPADQLVHEAADLGEVACDRQHLLAEPVLHRVADACGEVRLEVGGGGGERLDLLACALERRVDRGGVRAARCRRFQPLSGAIDSVVHGCDVTVPTGWMSPSWTTTFRVS